jgi:hypothetical protein
MLGDLSLRRDRFRCSLCGASPASRLGCELHIDHVVPVSRGGKTVATNLRTLCLDCNLGEAGRVEWPRLDRARLLADQAAGADRGSRRVVERGEASWGAHVPDLPGCVAIGETRADVLRLIREAMELP